jgi:hypothetical protein
VRLEQRIAELQTQLRKLSEAPAAKLNKGGKRGIPDSTPPPGSQPDRKGNPDPDDSLLHYFLWKLDRASTATARKAVVAEVEIRLTRRLKRPQDAEVVAGSTSSIIAVHDRIEERDRRIAEEYEGLEPAEVAAIESEIGSYCPEANVRKVRFQHKRDPETGMETGEEPRDRAYARELRDAGLSINSIALRMGKAKSTVQSWLEGERAA